MLYILMALLACSDIAIYGKPDEQNIIAFPEHINFGHLTSVKKRHWKSLPLLTVDNRISQYRTLYWCLVTVGFRWVVQHKVSGL